jgi:hypothetical protein
MLLCDLADVFERLQRDGAFVKFVQMQEPQVLWCEMSINQLALFH